MVPALENVLVKLHLRPKERAPIFYEESDYEEPVSEKLVYEEPVSEERSNKDGEASEEDGEYHSIDPCPATVLDKGLLKFYLRPKESISERPSEELVPEESSKDGEASKEKNERCCTGSVESLPSMDGCGHWWILLPVSWRKIHGSGQKSTSGVGQKHGKSGQGTIERYEINTEGLLYTS